MQGHLWRVSRNGRMSDKTGSEQGKDGYDSYGELSKLERSSGGTVESVRIQKDELVREEPQGEVRGSPPRLARYALPLLRNQVKVLCQHALKGQKLLAQGIALGIRYI